jgi:hypothetical protein
VPVVLTPEKVSVVFPALLSTMLWELLVPSTALPRFAEVGFAAISACVPVPVSTITDGDEGALLVIDMLPTALPPAVGVNVAVKFALRPALIT